MRLSDVKNGGEREREKWECQVAPQELMIFMSPSPHLRGRDPLAPWLSAKFNLFIHIPFWKATSFLILKFDIRMTTGIWSSVYKTFPSLIPSPLAGVRYSSPKRNFSLSFPTWRGKNRRKIYYSSWRRRRISCFLSASRALAERGCAATPVWGGTRLRAGSKGVTECRGTEEGRGKGERV